MRPLLGVLLAALLAETAGGASLALRSAQGTINAAGTHASARGASQAREAARSAEEVSDCSCDCCIADNIAQASRGGGGGSSGHVCTPRRAASSGCQPVCKASDELKTAFQARSEQVDYARYCLAACSPVDDEVNMLCMAAAQPGNSSAPAQLAAVSVKQQVSTDGSQATAEDAPVNAAALVLARGEMLQAKAHAEAAGAGAKAAREAYEAIVASASSMGEAAGKATVDEMRKEAGKQAKRALLVRQKWEDGVRQGALKAAIAAAQTYRDAKQRDMLLAGSWTERAGQFANAASEREQIATRDTALAQQYRAQKEYDLAKDYSVQAQAAMDASRDFEKRAAATNKQAAAIRQGAMWYDYAAQAAAQNVIAGSIPPGVMPPVLPPLA